MTEACFHSKIAGNPAASAAHNTRDWTAEHPAPKYIADFAAHVDPRGNESGGPFLSRDQVTAEYIEQTDYGRRTGKVHNRAKLFREAVINCTEKTTARQVKKLVKTLEQGLGVRCMAWHLHRDEGHIDPETRKPKHNYHLHFEYTNFKDGQTTYMTRERMRRAQDICADVLDMPRGKPAAETGRKHLSRAQYVRMAEAVTAEQENTAAAIKFAADGEQEKATLRKQAQEAKTKATDLVAENKRLRQALKKSGIATQEDYMKLAEIKKSDLDLEEKVLVMAQHVDDVLEARASDPDLAPVPMVTISDEVLSWQRQEQKRKREEREALEQKNDEVADNLANAEGENVSLAADLDEKQEDVSRLKVALTLAGEQMKRDRQRYRELVTLMDQSGDQAQLLAARPVLTAEATPENGWSVYKAEREREFEALQKENAELKTERNRWKNKYDDLARKAEPYLTALKELPNHLKYTFKIVLPDMIKSLVRDDKEKPAHRDRLER